jgi:hypothetical protein
MSSGHQEYGSLHLFQMIEKDFEALARLIDRVLERLAVEGASQPDIERLVLAKRAAERGARLSRLGPTSNPT